MTRSSSLRPIRRAALQVIFAAALSLALSGCLKGPPLTVTTVVSGLDHPWDVAFADGTMIYTERPGRISAFVGEQKRVLAAPADVVQASEAGMMGLEVDPQFSSNRFIYTCHASTLGGPANDVRITRWRVDSSFTALTDRTDIVTGLPVNASGELGRHSGCRPRFGPDGYLWVGTGDAAIGSVPQNPRSLGGKVLRITRDGAGAPGNPGGALDPRIWSYGHRNLQGLAFRPSDGLGVSTEHGPGVDDELNPLGQGNFGWDPIGPGGAYNEAVPMTDLAKFPSAVRAIWSSGSPTQAPSGATFVTGAAWGDWNGAVAVVFLRAQRLVVFGLNATSSGVSDIGVSLGNHGRLRSVVQGPNGSLYVTTDNGGAADKILRLAPA
jgi:aldose sugar dehydrogenase